MYGVIYTPSKWVVHSYLQTRYSCVDIALHLHRDFVARSNCVQLTGTENTPRCTPLDSNTRRQGLLHALRKRNLQTLFLRESIATTWHLLYNIPRLYGHPINNNNGSPTPCQRSRSSVRVIQDGCPWRAAVSQVTYLRYACRVYCLDTTTPTGLYVVKVRANTRYLREYYQGGRLGHILYSMVVMYHADAAVAASGRTGACCANMSWSVANW